MENLTNFGANASMFTIVLTLLISITLLYFARTPAHALLQALGNGLYQGFIFLSRAFSQLAHKLNLRNREVLLAVAKADSERRIEREHARVQSYIERDLAGYPEMQRRITEIVEKLEVSYQDSTDNPPLPCGLSCGGSLYLRPRHLPFPGQSMGRLVDGRPGDCLDRLGDGSHLPATARPLCCASHLLRW